MLYAWVDQTVWNAHHQGHAKLEDLPPLADHDHAKNLVKRSFPVQHFLRTPRVHR